MTLDSTSQWAAIKEYEEILTKDPRSYCFAPLAELYRQLGLLDDAWATAQKGCALHPNFAAGQMVLGCSLLDKGDEEAGRRALAKVVTITPDNLTAQRLLSHLYVAAGEYESAEDALHIILSLDPHDTESRLVLESLPKLSPATASFVLPSPSMSIEVAQANDVTEEFPDDDEIIELTEEVFEEEVEQCDDVATVSAAEPSSTAPLSTATMAELYVQQGFVQQAIGIYKEMLADDPTNDRIDTRLKELLNQSSSLPVTDSSAPAYPVDTTQMVEGGLLVTLERWLDNIGRIKACRSKSA